MVTTKKPAVSKKPVKKPVKSGEPVEIVCVIDRSGSMESIKNDAIGGFNNFLSDQKKQDGKATMTIIQFDNEYLIQCSGKPIQEVQPFDDRTYVPRGSTALLDAVGRAIVEVKSRNPKKAIIMILTDGHENASKEFNKTEIKKLIAECEKKEWCVIYLSADASAFDDAGSIGIPMSNTTSFVGNARGAQTSTMAASYACNDYRTLGRLGRGMTAYSTMAQQNYDTKHKYSSGKSNSTQY
jgi:hypothetical protein